MNKQKVKSLSQFLVASSVFCVLLAAVGYLWVDIWLASTQWLLVASVLCLFGLYLKED